MIRLRVMDDGPFRILVQESPHGWQKPWAAVFSAFAEDLRVMQHNPATDLAGVAMELVRQLIRGVPSVDEQQIARINVDRDGNSTFVAAIFSNLLTATGAGARFLPPRLLQKN